VRIAPGRDDESPGGRSAHVVDAIVEWNRTMLMWIDLCAAEARRRLRAPIALALALTASAWTESQAQPFGLDGRTTNSQIVITELPDDQPGDMELVRVFPNLNFSESVLLVDPMDGTHRLFHVSRNGLIHVFPNIQDPPDAVTPADVTLFLDVNDLLRDPRGNEEGLLGLAFDPDFGDPASPHFGEFYIHYSAEGKISHFSRYTLDFDDPSGNTADPGSEEIVLAIDHGGSNHKGGTIAFGPDGMFYVTQGDGGGQGDPDFKGQDRTLLVGKILRIDVRSPPDVGLNYAIPPDNPFVDDPDPEVRREIYAYGMRNPYRMSFDAINGFLFVGDVGQDLYEEIDVIEAGGNYGWSVMEGAHAYQSVPGAPPAFDPSLKLPIEEYDHSGSTAVVGGHVYYGSEVPELYGTYLYSRAYRGEIWGLKYDGELTTSTGRLATSNFFLTGFGQDEDGEVYALDFDGGIYALRPMTPGGGSNFPLRLSDIPELLAAGSGLGHTIDGVIPYEPSAKLWSDGAEKERYIILPDYQYPAPNYAQITFNESVGWDFPNDTVLVKNFLLPLDLADPLGSLRRIETRLLVKHSGNWSGFSYLWDEDETDATLLTTDLLRPYTILDEMGQPIEYSWYYPNRSDCAQCHTGAINRVAGVNSAQMNFDFTYPLSGVTDNQLRAFEHIGLFDAPLPAPPAALPAMPDARDETASIEDRARAYLAANCALCHQPTGPAPTIVDFRWLTPTGSMNAVGEAPDAGDLGIEGAEIIKVGAPGESIALARMISTDPTVRMPPLATSRVDEAAVELIEAWIANLLLATPASRAFIAPAASATIDVETGDGIAWTAETNEGWIHIDSGSAGVGDGQIEYSVDANTGPPRVGSILVGGVTHAISQGAAGDLDGDGEISLTELNSTLLGFRLLGAAPPQADLDGDGDITFEELTHVLLLYRGNP
jgi:uncharacterized repeat protein (TIGR03806 family)